MRSHRRRHPLRHVLIAGGVADLPDIRHELAQLPADAYGQVLVEVPLGVELHELVRPARVSVHRLDHIATIEPMTDGRSVLAAAVDAWLSEWLPAEPEGDREVTLWISGAARAVAPLDVLGDLVEGA